MTLCISHYDYAKQTVIIDALRWFKSPFSPEVVVKELRACKDLSHLNGVRRQIRGRLHCRPKTVGGAALRPDGMKGQNMPDQQQFFDARDLRRTQVPYYEPDVVAPVITAVTRTMLHAAQWRLNTNLHADTEVVSE